MKLKPRRVLVLPILLLLLSGFACQQVTVEAVSRDLLAVSKAASILQTNVIDAHSRNLIPTPTATTIIEASKKANEAGLEATRITRSISQIDPASKLQILQIIKPIAVSVNTLARSNTFGEISDQTTKNTIIGLLSALDSTLSVVQLTLAGGS